MNTMNTRSLDVVEAELAKFNRAHAVVAAGLAERRAAELASKSEAEAKAEAKKLDLIKLIDPQRRSLARDLGLDDVATAHALAAKRAALGVFPGRMWAPLQRLWSSTAVPTGTPGYPNTDAARDSRHVLAALGHLPPVRRSDEAFGTEAQVRAIPALALDFGEAAADAVSGRYQVIASEFGCPMPRLQPPGVETPQTALKRLGRAATTNGDFARALGEDRPGVATVVNQRARELEVVAERLAIARTQRGEEHRRALVAHRTQFVAAIDRELGKMPLNSGWWWLRQLRRIAALERQVRIADNHEAYELAIGHIVHQFHAGGGRLVGIEP